MAPNPNTNTTTKTTQRAWFFSFCLTIVESESGRAQRGAQLNDNVNDMYVVHVSAATSELLAARQKYLERLLHRLPLQACRTVDTCGGFPPFKQVVLLVRVR